MTGDLIIDTKDAYDEWGIIVADGGLKEVVCLPPLKDYPKNDWFEQDGIDADLSAPVLNTRELTIKFVSTKGFSYYYSFIDYLDNASEHQFYFKFIDKTFKLRLVSFSSLDRAQYLGWLSVKFADDYPLDGYTYQAPTGGGVIPKDGWKIDGKKFTDYGITVLEGSATELLKGHAVKTALLRNIKTKAGAIYDTDATVTYKSKDAKLQCLLRADGTADMWRNWYAFIYDFVKPGEHQIYAADANSLLFFCCYKSCSVTEFLIDGGRPWIKFSLTVTITSNFRNDDADSILSAENDAIIYDELEYTAFKVIKKQ